MKLLPYILFEKYIYILALEMASSGNQHCANCIGTLSFLLYVALLLVSLSTSTAPRLVSPPALREYC